jgi:hypothetical protein
MFRIHGAATSGSQGKRTYLLYFRRPSLGEELTSSTFVCSLHVLESFVCDLHVAYDPFTYERSNAVSSISKFNFNIY